MTLTAERADALANYLIADNERAKKLLELSPEAAVLEINKDGFDFKTEELQDFGEQLQTLAGVAGENGELDVDALSNVTGGIVISGAVAAALIGGGITMFTAGLTFGYQVARERGW